MKTKREKAKWRISSAMAQLALCALGLYLVVSLVMSQVEIVTQRQVLNAANEQLSAQSIQNDEMRRVIESGSEDDYVERIARDKLGYARQNERIYQDTSGK